MKFYANFIISFIFLSLLFQIETIVASIAF